MYKGSKLRGGLDWFYQLVRLFIRKRVLLIAFVFSNKWPVKRQVYVLILQTRKHQTLFTVLSVSLLYPFYLKQNKISSFVFLLLLFKDMAWNLQCRPGSYPTSSNPSISASGAWDYRCANLSHCYILSQCTSERTRVIQIRLLGLHIKQYLLGSLVPPSLPYLGPYTASAALITSFSLPFYSLLEYIDVLFPW